MEKIQIITYLVLKLADMFFILVFKTGSIRLDILVGSAEVVWSGSRAVEALDGCKATGFCCGGDTLMTRRDWRAA
jgi:hypothetical protein